MVTGGISAGVFISADFSNPSRMIQRMNMSSNCLDSTSLSNARAMYALMTEILSETRWENDLERLQTVITGMATSSSNSVAQSGHQYAMTMASKSLSEVGRLNEMLNGIEQVTFINGLANRILSAAGEEEISIVLKEIAAKLKVNPWYFKKIERILKDFYHSGDCGVCLIEQWRSNGTHHL